MRLARHFFLLIALCFLPQMVHGATLYLDPDTGRFGPGDTFIADVRLDNDDECVNAGQIILHYPTEVLRAVDFSRGGSIFSLWVQDPVLDTAKGIVTFAGGVPGGYCGRIPGDPALSNVLGKVVFTVVGDSLKEANIDFDPMSALYLNDGLGTSAAIVSRGAQIAIASTPQLKTNEWLDQVRNDTIPPDSFVVEVQSTRSVFGGRYYAVFGTVDKQSGIDHYEIQEKGVWKRIESPYQLKDQFLQAPVIIRAIDKAGNEQLGEYAAEAVPPRQFAFSELLVVAGVLVALVLGGGLRWYVLYRRARAAKAGMARRV